jgi:hypothetical protein
MLSALAQCWGVRDVDLAVSTSPQFFCGMAGYFVSRLKRCPWVLEIRDLGIESESDAELAKVVLWLARDPGLRREHGERGAAFAACNFNRETLAMRYLGVLEGMVGKWEKLQRKLAGRSS